MPKLVTLSHEFLRSFCRNNIENQFRLYKHISIEQDAKEGCLRVNTVKLNFMVLNLFDLLICLISLMKDVLLIGTNFVMM